MTYKFRHTVLAMAIGAGTGFLLSAGAQKLINDYYLKDCPTRPGHQLMYFQNLLGDKYFCVDSRIL
jgi:hypothetical protein